MQTIHAAITSPTVAGVVVHGAAGVGKSRIVREALTAAASNGAEVRWAVGSTSANTLPLGAFAAWTNTTQTDTLDLVRGAIESLTAAPSNTMAIVGVDDAHLLDDLSAFVLHQIVQRGAAKVVVTVRDGEPVPLAVQDIWKGGQLDRLDLQPLSMSETATLLSTTLNGTVDPDTAARLWRLTRGNVLYLRNIVEQEIDDGRLAEHRGYWRWCGQPVLPPGLVELVDSRMGSLPKPVADVVDTLAIGEPLELTALSRITDPAAVEEADIRGLITLENADGRVEVRVAHPLYGEVRRHRVAVTKLRRLRGLVAAELANAPNRDDLQIVVRRATLSLDSDLELDASLLTRAARGAVWLWNLELADRLAEAGVRAGGVAEASLIRAYALSCLGRGAEADAVLETVPAADLTDIDRGRLTFQRAVNRLFTLADPAGAKKFIDAASAAIGPQGRFCVDAFLAVYWAAMGQPQKVSDVAQTFAWDELPDAIAQRMTAWALAVAAADAGRMTQAIAAAGAGYLVPIRSYVIIVDAEASALLLAGEVAGAQKPVDMIRQRAQDVPEPRFLMIARALAGRVALGAGRLDEACSRLGIVVDELFASGETNGWDYRCQILHTQALALRGSTRDACDAFAVLESRRHAGCQYLDYEHAIARAWVTAGQGAVSEAIKLVVSGAETARAKGQFAAEVMCLQTATQFGDGSHAARLRELQNIVEGPRSGLAARFAQALSDGDAAELSTVSEQFEDIGDLIAAIDAAAHAALIHRDADRKGSSLTCSARADELAHRCGGASTPALRKASKRLPLSDREREIAMLIGLGLSNGAIAERLTLSVRTVEGHIYRAMAKTGAADRDELAAMLSSSHDSTKLIR
jgi:DNA-binding CsgD family transcriptional regulator